jgi:hypothetical protein
MNVSYIIVNTQIKIKKGIQIKSEMNYKIMIWLIQRAIKKIKVCLNYIKNGVYNRNINKRLIK